LPPTPPPFPYTTLFRSKDDTVVLTVTDAGLAHRMSSAIQASIETIRRRVGAFGTTEPSIQREGRSRVLVQVPGISDVERWASPRSEEHTSELQSLTNIV